MNEPSVYSLISPRHREIIVAVRSNAETLLNCSPRFKLFTLHGSPHIANLFRILDLLIQGGLKLSEEELYLLSLAICVHDLGMVVGLKDQEIKQLLIGRDSAADPTIVESKIRDNHHLMVDLYIEKNFNFLIALGVTSTELNHVASISKCHRKVVLSKQYGIIKNLGALIRVIDELDVGPERAPMMVLSNQSDELDVTSLWHWVKHNIIESWTPNHNVNFKDFNGRRSIEFSLIAHPANAKSIPYWLYQTRRPILRALIDDGCAQIIAENYNINIEIHSSENRSSPSVLGFAWKTMEDRALSGGRKVVMLVDDEVRKMEDLMLPLSLSYHVVYGSSATDAFTKIAAGPVDLVIVDMQIGGYGLWTAEETQDYKKTGLNIIGKIQEEYPLVKVGVLTGTRHDISDLKKLKLSFILKKPCDPTQFTAEVKNALN